MHTFGYFGGTDNIYTVSQGRGGTVGSVGTADIAVAWPKRMQHHRKGEGKGVCEMY